jgi:hypothetical protein
MVKGGAAGGPSLVREGLLHLLLQESAQFLTCLNFLYVSLHAHQCTWARRFHHLFCKKITQDFFLDFFYLFYLFFKFLAPRHCSGKTAQVNDCHKHAQEIFLRGG